jgi:cysteine desulfurase
MIYLDGHSTTPIDPRVFEAMKPYFLERFGNASHGVHRLNWEAESGVALAREQLARLIGSHEKEIIFTSGATESNHIAILGLIPYLTSVQRRKVLSIQIEHASVLGALEIMEERGFQVDWVQVDSEGRVNLEDLKARLGSDTGLVSIALGNHEIGTIQDLAMISKLAHESGALVHTDAVQALGKLRFTVDSLGIDLMTLSGHKVHGPKGVGALYVRRKNPRVELEPIMFGGGQERGMRPGTPNSPAIVGFGSAAEILFNEMDHEIQRLTALRDQLWLRLKSGLPCLVRNGPEAGGLPHNLNVSVKGVDGAALFGRFKNIAVSNASACLNGTQDYSQVLTVLGVNKDLARATLRFGVGRLNDENQIIEAADEVIRTVKELRKIERDFAEQAGIPYMNGECDS